MTDQTPTPTVAPAPSGVADPAPPGLAATAACAWYAAAAGVINGRLGRMALWVGHPLGAGRSMARASQPLPGAR